jgi:hypothetical protein
MTDSLSNWQQKILHMALEFEFIEKTDIEESIKILNRYNSESELFYHCHDSLNKTERSLANASQI